MALNLTLTARLSNIAGFNQARAFEAAQRRQDRDQLESILSQIDRMDAKSARSLLASCNRKLANQSWLLGGKTPDAQDRMVVRAIEARITALERGALLSRAKYH